MDWRRSDHLDRLWSGGIYILCLLYTLGCGRQRCLIEAVVMSALGLSLAWQPENGRVSNMLKTETIPILQIYVPVKRRGAVKPEVVRQIAESMLESGQESPILVRRDGDRFVLVEGLQRLEACKALGEQTILGFLVTAHVGHRGARPLDEDTDDIRQKTERLRKLRLAKEAEEIASAASKAPNNRATVSDTCETPRHRQARPEPATLSEWLAARESQGFRS
jgi:hypothetical protein